MEAKAAVDWSEPTPLRYDALTFETGGEFDEEAFVRVLGEAVRAVDGTGVPYLLMGGVASAALGRPRWTHDVDVFVRPEEARQVLSALAGAGFATQETYPDWLFKAIKDGVLVDVIFRSFGDIYLDDEMLERAQVRGFKGVTLRLVSPEDLVVIKAVVHDEHMPRHWHDSLGLITSGDIDWEYLLRRARHGARRVLSLLVYAQSNDLIVPDWVIRRLFHVIYGDERRERS